MARVGQRTAVAGGQLADSVSVGVLEKAFSRALVDEVVEACGRKEQRVRALPARVMAYFCLGLALWSDGSYEDVLGMVSSGLRYWAQGGDGPPQMASKVALFKARVRLGPEPLEMLFRRGAVPIGKPDWDDCFLGGGVCWRSMGPRWMCPTRPPMMSISVGLVCPRVNVPRFRWPAWWSRSVAPMRSWARRSARTQRRRSACRKGWSTGSHRAAW